MPQSQPSHSLDEIQRLVQARTFVIYTPASYTALAMGFDDEDIAECILALGPGDFYKTMPSIKRQGHMQDVYKTRYSDKDVYLKVDLCPGLVVISFKEDQSS